MWLEHKNAPELIDSGTPARSELTPVLKMISDNHFWVLRAGLLATIILAFYYKDKDADKYLLFRNISLSAVLILIFASGIITWILKISIGKPRPYTKLTEYISMAFSSRFQSFPSGHTTETFSYLFPYIYFLKKYSVGIMLFLSGLIISSFRIFLSYHYITDVIFGIYITIITGYIICIYIEKKSVNSTDCAL
ncbi:MAG: phosphatase PAP2 family protein [Spirochaetes bacterium]|nr:phosphatase PAP2 family protein [Spirochaetota bacterium]